MIISLDWLPQTAFFYLLVFSRVGAMLMLAPAFGENAIPSRIRLGFALIFSMIVYPLVADKLPAIPQNLTAMGFMVLREVAVGLILGGIARMIVMATQTAGSLAMAMLSRGCRGR